MEQSEASIFTLRNFNWVGIYLHINKKAGICTLVNRFIFFKKICLKCAKLNSYLNGLLCRTTPQNTLENISKSSIWAVHSCCLQSQTTCLFMKSRFFYSRHHCCNAFFEQQNDNQKQELNFQFFLLASRYFFVEIQKHFA